MTSPLRDMDEAAAYCRMGRSVFSRKVNAGEIPYITYCDDPEARNAKKLFLEADLDKFIRDRRRKARAAAAAVLPLPHHRRARTGTDRW